MTLVEGGGVETVDPGKLGGRGQAHPNRWRTVEAVVTAVGLITACWIMGQFFGWRPAPHRPPDPVAVCQTACAGSDWVYLTRGDAQGATTTLCRCGGGADEGWDDPDSIQSEVSPTPEGGP